MGASTMCFGFLHLHCSYATLSNAETLSSLHQEVMNMESCRETNLVSVFSTSVLEQILFVVAGKWGSAGSGWQHWMSSKGGQVMLPIYVMLSHPSQA